MKKIKGYNIVKAKTNELLVSIEIGNDEVIERDGYKVIPLFDEIIENPTIEQNAGENRIEGGVLSLSVAPKELNKHCKWCKGKGCNCGNCSNKDEENSYYLLHKEKFPEPQERTFRPFKNCDELVECWGQKMYIPAIAFTKDHRDKLYRPSIWVKHKEYGTDNLIIAYDNDNESIGGSCVFIQDIWIDMNELFDNFTFCDGSVCGMEE